MRSVWRSAARRSRLLQISEAERAVGGFCGTKPHRMLLESRSIPSSPSLTLRNLEPLENAAALRKRPECPARDVFLISLILALLTLNGLEVIHDGNAQAGDGVEDSQHHHIQGQGAKESLRTGRKEENVISASVQAQTGIARTIAR